MRIVYAIILAIYLVGCDDGKKADVVGGGNGGGGDGLGTTGGNRLAPEILKASQLNKARNELIKAIVEKGEIARRHPHQMFMDIVNKVPKADDFDPFLLYTIESVLANIDDRSLPEAAKDPKANLIAALKKELSAFADVLVLTSAAQFLLTREKYNEAEKLRKQIDSAKSDAEAIEFQQRLNPVLLSVPPAGSAESVIQNMPDVRRHLVATVEEFLDGQRRSTPPKLDYLIPSSPLIPWKIVEKGKSMVQLEAAKDPKAETTRSEYYQMISKILSAEHPVMKLWKNVPQGDDFAFAALHQATIAARDECVAEFPKLEKDAFYEAMDAYEAEIKVKGISDSDRIKAQEELIAAIPADRAESQPIKGLLEAYKKAKA